MPGKPRPKSQRALDLSADETPVESWADTPTLHMLRNVDRWAKELSAELDKANFSSGSEVFLLIHRQDRDGNPLPTLWTDITPQIRHGAGQSAIASTETDVLRQLAIEGLLAWLSHCTRAPLFFADLPDAPCQVTNVVLQIHHYET